MKKYGILILLLLFSVQVFAQQAPPEFRLQQQTETAPPASGAKYVLLSLILPGAGEWAMGHKTLAKFFLGTEFLMWTGYFGTQQYIHILEQDYQAYAALHAGVASGNKDDSYWSAVGNADNIYEYNQKRLRERDLKGMYPESDPFLWQWDASEHRYRYNRMRVERHDWERRATIMASGFILNRLISAIDVVRLIRKDAHADRQKFSRLFFSYRDRPLAGESYQLNLMLRW